MTESLLKVLKMTTVQMGYFTGLILVVGLMLGFFEKTANTFMQRSLGRKGIFITAFIGTPIHEIGHAIMCIIFNHKIMDIKLLNLKDKSGVLGYVKHSYNKNSLYQRIGNLFIALGPIFSGTSVLILALYSFMPESFSILKRYVIYGINSDKIDKGLIVSLLNLSGGLLKSVFSANNFQHLSFWIFIIVAICVSSHMALSKADIENGKDGFLVLFAFIFIVNIVLVYFSVNITQYKLQLIRYNIYLSVFLMIALMFSLFSLGISFLCYLLFSKKS
ncbi:hypothetical protein [Clostridium algidicarnis]|uniref:hypothetical protein n=1 Tax=Clostridium algidicarnis TaxID=37659 RepID=UPI003FD89191